MGGHILDIIKSSNSWKDFENKLDRKELDKKLQAQQSKDKLKDMQVITQELFALLDELDVVEGRGLQR